MITKEILWSKWIEKLTKENAKGKKRRNYVHFDRKINLFTNNIINKSIVKKLKKQIIDRDDLVVSHAFYPFIYFEVTHKKYKFDETKDRGCFKIKNRPICFASHYDSILYSWYSFYLNHFYEEKLKKYQLENNILAYRNNKSKSTINYAKEVFDELINRQNHTSIALDLSKFFDTINHEILKEALHKLLDVERLPDDIFRVFKNITEFSIIEKEFLLDEFGHGNNSKKKFYKRNDKICEPFELRKFLKLYPQVISRNYKRYGIPQGSPISGLLSNIFLLEFDKKIKSKIVDVEGMYRRYSDDIFIICPRNQVKSILKFILDEISTFKVNINNSKTEVRHFEKDFRGKLFCFKDQDKFKKHSKVQYLGFEFTGEDVFIRSSSISNFYKKVRLGAKNIAGDLYKEKSVPNQIFKKSFYSRYSTRKGQNNFITYLQRSDKIFDKKGIKKQINRHFDKINAILDSEISKKQKRIIKKFKSI